MNASLTITESVYIGKSNQSGLIEVIGEVGTTNTFNVSSGAAYTLQGVITDKPDGGDSTTSFIGDFAGLMPLDLVNLNSSSARPERFIEYARSLDKAPRKI